MTSLDEYLDEKEDKTLAASKEDICKSIYAFALALTKWTSKMSSTYRYSMGGRINGQCMLLLSELSDYSHSASIGLPEKMCSKLRLLELYLSLCRDMGQMKAKRYEAFSEMISRVNLLLVFIEEQNTYKKTKL